MALLDGPAQDIASTLTTVFGTPATLRRTTNVYDPVTGVETPTVTDHAYTITPPQRVREDLVDNSNVLATDLEASVATKDLPDDATPAPVVPNTQTDTLIFGTETYKVVAVMPLYGGALVASYTMRLRK